MIKDFFRFSIILIALFIGAINYSDSFQKPFFQLLIHTKITYLNTINAIENNIEKYFNQAQHIEELKKKLQNYNENNLLTIQLISELKFLYKENNSTLNTDPKVELVRALSYAQFGNFNQVWLDNVKDYNNSKIYGLIYNDSVAGIVISKNNQPLALLNKDIKSSYAVYVGKHKAPGIAHGNNGENIIVKFIPAWFKISVGDEIITSGLDNIFFHGLKVGRVLSVKAAQGYQNAIVQPYFQANELNYFYMIKSVK